MSMLFKAYLCCLFAVMALSSFARASDSSSNIETISTDKISSRQSTSVEFNMDYIKGYWTDTKNIITSPARWDSNDWLKASFVVGTSLVLYIEDDNIKTWIQRNKNNTTSHLADDAKTATRYSLVALGGLGIYGYAASDDKAKTTFLLSTESFLLTGAFVQVLKHTTGRARPYTGEPHDTWYGLTSQGDHMSFPSGDASSAFAISAVVASEYDNAFVPPILYGLSTLVALERVHNNAHWASDVFVGSAIGYFTGKAVVESHSIKKEGLVRIAPLVNNDEYGFLITYCF
jgi:hypothetical protein